MGVGDGAGKGTGELGFHKWTSSFESGQRLDLEGALGPQASVLLPAPCPHSSSRPAQGHLHTSESLLPPICPVQSIATAERAHRPGLAVLSSAVPLASQGAHTWQIPSSCLLSELPPTFPGEPTCRVYPPGTESTESAPGAGLQGGRREGGSMTVTSTLRSIRQEPETSPSGSSLGVGCILRLGCCYGSTFLACLA